jgi:hypothetical protein
MAQPEFCLGPRAVPRWRERLLSMGLLSLLVFALWRPALEAERVSDDFRLVGRIGFPDALRYFRQSFGFGRNEYRPLTAASFALDRWFWGEGAAGYHVTNLALHWTVSVLLFGLVRRLLQDAPLALLASALFAVHPITHERVVWIAARDGLVSGVFLMAALRLYAAFRRSQRPSLLFLALGAQTAALLSYEGAVALPLLVLAAEACFFAGGRRLHDTLRFTWPFAAVTGAYVALWWLMFRGSVGAYAFAGGVGEVVENYGRLMHSLFFGHRRLLLAAAYAVIGLSALARLRSWRPAAAFGCAFLAIAYLPFAALDGFAHRFGYTSAAGFATLLAGAILCTIRLGRPAARTAVVVAAVLLSGYYLVEVRRIVAEWIGAGTIAAQLPGALRDLQPHLPEGAVVMIRGVPAMHGRAMVFPTGLEVAIEQRYGKRLNVRNVAVFDHEAIRAFREAGSPVYCFEWTPPGRLQPVTLPP